MNYELLADIIKEEVGDQLSEAFEDSEILTDDELIALDYCMSVLLNRLCECIDKDIENMVDEFTKYCAKRRATQEDPELYLEDVYAIGDLWTAIHDVLTLYSGCDMLDPEEEKDVYIFNRVSDEVEEVFDTAMVGIDLTAKRLEEEFSGKT